jgi:hypothetical protein
MLERFARLIEPTLVETPPDPWSLAPRQLLKLAQLAGASARLGPRRRQRHRDSDRRRQSHPRRWFESEVLKTTLSTDAIIGAFATPSMPGTAYVLFPPRDGGVRRRARGVGIRARRHGRAVERPRRPRHASAA